MTAIAKTIAGDSIQSAVYVDMENLAGKGKELLIELLAKWPDKAPKPSVVHLYVRADQVGLWSVWGDGRFRDVRIVPHGVQHYSNTNAKNSADVALVIDAITDLLIGATEHITIVSDDSDFLALYSAMISRPDMPYPDEAPPFLLVVTRDKGKQSETIHSFVPPEHLHVIGAGTPAKANSPKQANVASDKALDYEKMAQSITKELPVGTFKSTDCQEIIKRSWAGHALAQADGAKFGTDFKAKIWPHLQKLGVRIPNENSKPLKYEMTQQAKQQVGEG